MTFSAGSAVSDGGFPPTPLGGWFNDRRADSQSNYVSGKWSHRVEQDNTVQVTGFINDFHASPGLKSAEYRYQQYALQFSHTFKPVAAHTVTWGLDSRGDVVDGSVAEPSMLRGGNVATGTLGLYAQDEWHLAPRWTLSLGGRMDYDTRGGVQPSGRAALSHQLTDDTALYGAVSRAFHMVPGAMRCVEMTMLDGLSGISVDPAVPATTLLAYELGLRGKYFDRLDLNANWFWHDYQDVYTALPRPGPPGLLKFEFDSHADPDLYGVELEAKYALTKKLQLLGHYTYQQMDWGASGGLWQKDAMTTPRHKFMVGARYDPRADLHLSTHLYFVDGVQAPNPDFPFVARDIGAYFRLDVQAEYEFWNKRAALAVGVRNLLDDHHPEGTSLFINSAEVPRMIYAELRIRLP